MNNMRKVFCFLMATVLAAFALPGIAAPQKQFSVDGLPASMAPSTTQTLTLTFTNQTPVGGVSTINSLRLIAPTGWSLSNPVAIIGGTVSGGTPVETGPATVAFASIPGIKAGGNTWKMQVTVTAPTASAPCSNAWGAQAFAGNSLNGDQFLLINTPASLNSNVGKIINASAGAGGSITPSGAPSGAVSVSCGANQTFTITPNQGYHLLDVLVDGVSVGAVTTYTFTNVLANHTIAASFAINTYTIGGTVTGLGSGKSVVLQNNGGNNLTVSTNGSFTFTTPVNYGGSYVVTVLTQPTGQTCTVSSGSGSNVTANVTGVVVNCATNTYTIGGTVTSLSGSVVLQNNGGNNLTVSANGSFTFTTPVNYGGSYVVTVLTQPTGQTCTVSSGSGSNVTADVTGVVVNCTTNTLTIHAPSTATLNTPFTVTVDLIPPGTASVTLTSSDCTLSSGPGSLAVDGSSVTFNQVTITAAPSFACTITASAGSAYSSSTATISPILTAGVLGCGDPPNNNKAGNLAVNNDPPLAYIGPPDWGLERSLNNKDGNPCVTAVPFIFEFDPTNNTAAFIIPDTLGQKVAVEYVLLWRPTPTDNPPAAYQSLPFALAQLAWVKNTSGAWVFVPGLACVEDDVDLGFAQHGEPEPVMPMIPNVEPFITLGATYSDYAPGAVAKVCIAQEGWTAIGRNGNVILRQYWHKVIDYADAAIKLP